MSFCSFSFFFSLFVEGACVFDFSFGSVGWGGGEDGLWLFCSCDVVGLGRWWLFTFGLGVAVEGLVWGSDFSTNLGISEDETVSA